VTLCIAAECEYKGTPALALLADLRSQTWDSSNPGSMVGSEDVYKMQEVGGATMLLAGNRPLARALASVCKPSVLEFVQSSPEHENLDLAIDELRLKIEKATAERKAEMIRQYVRSTHGMAYEEFIRLSTTEYADVWQQVRSLHFQAELLICCVIHEPIIIRVDHFGKTHWIDKYAAIGSGADIARAMLCLQLWVPARLHRIGSHELARVPLEECIFRLMEAHHVAHKANPSLVGGYTAAQILFPHHRCTTQPHFIGATDLLILKKYEVPQIEPVRGKGELLRIFQSFSTGSIQDEEPDVL